MNAFRRASIKRDGAWTPVVDLYVKHAGAWKKVDDGYVKYQGQWMLVHNPDAVIVLNYTIPYYSTSESYHYSNFNLLDWVSSHEDRTGFQWPRDVFKTYPFNITVTIESGVIIKGPFTIPADFDKATRVVLKNHGSIYGSAGKGGDALVPYDTTESGSGYLKTLSSANGKDGSDAIVNHSNLVLQNYGNIYPGGGGGHGGIPNLYVSISPTTFPYLFNEVPGWWGSVQSWLIQLLIYVPSCNPSYVEWYMTQYPGGIPYFGASSACNGSSWYKFGSCGGWPDDPLTPQNNYGYDYSSTRKISAVKIATVTAFHGSNGGGGAGVDSSAGDYSDLLKPISNIGNILLDLPTSVWGEVKDILSTIASSMSIGDLSDAEALSLLQAESSKYNFRLHSVNLSTGKIYWELPSRVLYVAGSVYQSGTRYWYGRAIQWNSRSDCYGVTNPPTIYWGISNTNEMVGLTKNYYGRNWTDSAARQQSYTLGTAGTLLNGGQGGKTTYSQTTPSSSWFNAWNGQAGNGGGPGQDGQSLTIPASSHNGSLLPAITISGGKGGAPIRTYSNRGSFTLKSNSGTISGQPVYS